MTARIAYTSKSRAGVYAFGILGFDHTLYRSGYVKREGNRWVVYFGAQYYGGVVGFGTVLTIEGYQVVKWQDFSTKKAALSALRNRFNCAFSR